MSRHRMYQNYDYENELDDYGGEEYIEEEGGQEELSPEDKVLMAEGTAEVRRALGPQADSVTTQQIQDSLWHYYYDVDKSIAYLINTYIDPAPKAAAKPKATTLKNAPSSDDSWRRECTDRTPSMADFFADMPWQNIPESRRTVFIQPPRSRGGLLGGSSAGPKTSKLAALAAARKRKAEEATLAIMPKREEKKVPKVETKSSHEDTHSKDSPRTGAHGQDPLLNNMQKEKTKEATRREDTHSESIHTQETEGTTPLPGSQTDGAPDDGTKSYMAEPSAFAQALFKSASETPRANVQHVYFPPWMAFTTPDALREAFEKPSPDDVVLAAQSQAGKKAPAKSNKGNTKDASNVGNEISKLKIAESAPLPKSKNLDVVKEYASSERKKELSFVVVGHVDSGKSTMLGRLLLDMKVVNQRTIDKYRKEAEKMGKSSFALAWVLDSRSEERSHGVTIDIATNHFETDVASFTLIDAPGHRDFIPNMLAGTSLADFAVLVVDAAKGAFEAGLKGQTREHALLLRSMGVFRIIVAVNKLDTSDWSTERFEEIQDQVLGSLKALKFPAKDISFVPVSGLKGENIVQRSKNPKAAWYTGPTLLEELEKSEPITSPKELEKPLRMMISDLWDTPLSPLTVSGRIDAGSLQVGDAVLVQPSGEKAYIKTIERNDEPVDWVVAGQHVTLSLSHIDEIHVHTGDVICSMKEPIPCVDTFTMRALAFDTFFPMPVDLHKGRFKAAAWIRELAATLDIQKGEVIKRKPQTVKAGAVARIRVRTEEGRKVPLEQGQRVVLRSQGNTVAAGLIE